MDDLNLKPCPFCRSTDLYDHEQEGIAWIECCDCNAEGPTTESIDDAVNAWNNRGGSE